MKLQLLILMAGRDDSFREAGYTYPKNLVEIDGLPMLQRVIDHISGLRNKCHSLVCVLRQDEDRKHHTGTVIKLIEPTATIVTVNESKGAACSALLAMKHFSMEDPLVIVNGDQIIKEDLEAIVSDFYLRNLDGGVVVFEAIHPRWSFVRCDENSEVVEAAEKRPISNLATAGFYYFAQSRYFFDAAKEMIKKDAHVDGFFYVCPVYNEMILAQKKVGIYKISRKSYLSLATPASVTAYEKSLIPTFKEPHT